MGLIYHTLSTEQILGREVQGFVMQWVPRRPVFQIYLCHFLSFCAYCLCFTECNCTQCFMLSSHYLLGFMEFGSLFLSPNILMDLWGRIFTLRYGNNMSPVAIHLAHKILFWVHLKRSKVDNPRETRFCTILECVLAASIAQSLQSLVESLLFMRSIIKQ